MRQTIPIYHFGTDNNADGNDDFSTKGTAGNVAWLDEPQLVVVLDADGDYYEEEIAEFAGLEEE